MEASLLSVSEGKLLSAREVQALRKRAKVGGAPPPSATRSDGTPPRRTPASAAERARLLSALEHRRLQQVGAAETHRSAEGGLRGLRVEPLPLLPPPPREVDVAPPSDWAAYYSWRGLALDSPLAVLLTFPLTLHHILARHVLPALPASRDTAAQPLRVHLLGPEKELALLPLFAELAHLQPATTIDIEMVGPAGLALPPAARFDGRLGGSVTVTAHGGLYHELPLKLARRGAADVVVALNAGLAAPGYDWSPTLGAVRRSGVPFFFTDYSEYSIEKAAAFAQRHAMAGALPVRLNPFRAPLRQPLVVGGAVAFPWVSNGFLAGFANGGRVASGGDADDY